MSLWEIHTHTHTHTHTQTQSIKAWIFSLDREAKQMHKTGFPCQARPLTIPVRTDFLVRFIVLFCTAGGKGEMILYYINSENPNGGMRWSHFHV